MSIPLTYNVPLILIYLDAGKRWVTMERNWSGRGSLIEGGYLSFGSAVRQFQIDEQWMLILAVIDGRERPAFVVRNLDDGKLLWSLSGVRTPLPLYMQWMI